MRSCHVLVLCLLTFFIGCAKKESSQDLREKTADATAEMKRDAKAVASGIREGWDRDKPLDLNSASRDQLLSLPGLTNDEADQIIAGRPHKVPDELVGRRILTKSEYDKISDRITAR